MPIYRGPDGKIIEERTRRIRDEEESDLKGSSSEAPTDLANKGSVVHDKVADNSDDLTKIVGNESPQADLRQESNSQTADDQKTVLFSMDDGLGIEVEASGAGTGPVVAWLVIVKGPGTGNVLSCGYGTNSIGRGGGAGIDLDFGDKQISRSAHAILTYDPRGRKFYIQHGSSSGLTYLGGQPVLVPTELESRAEISIGETRLMFVPLCGESFDWQDIKDGEQNAST